MLLLLTFGMSILAVVAFIGSVVSIMGGKIVLGIGFFIIAGIAAIVAASAYYAQEKVKTLREFLGWELSR